MVRMETTIKIVGDDGKNIIEVAGRGRYYVTGEFYNFSQLVALRDAAQLLIDRDTGRLSDKRKNESPYSMDDLPDTDEYGEGGAA